MGATVLAQVASYHEPGKMVEKWMETNPKDVSDMLLDQISSNTLQGCLVQSGRRTSGNENQTSDQLDRDSGPDHWVKLLSIVLIHN